MDTGEIYGCKEGTHKYYHEKGHIVFNKSEFGSNLLMYKSLAFDLWMLFVMASIAFVRGTVAQSSAFVICVIIYTFYVWTYFYEEHWCNKYADHHYKK